MEAVSVQYLKVAVAAATGLLQCSGTEANRTFLKMFLANKSDGEL